MDNNKLDTITNLFEGKEIRSIWNSEKEDYFFSVVDVISALTDSKIPKRYWSDLKRKLTEEGSQLYENIVQLKMLANDGKIAKNTRDNLEKELGKSVISKENALNYKYIDDKKLIEDKKSRKKK